MLTRIKALLIRLYREEDGFFPLIPLGISALGGFLGSKFAGGGGGKKKEGNRDEIQPVLNQLQGSATNLRQEGSNLSEMGAGPLGQSLNYLRQILSANGGQAMAAIAPERGRVIDQYDTARKAISSFGPRGGGSTSALAESRLSEAGDLSDLFTGARREAYGQGAALGTQLEGLGLSADQLASADLSRILDAILTQQGFDITKHGQNMQALVGAGEAAGTLLGLYLTKGKK